jgi:hypothetical protein
MDSRDLSPDSAAARERDKNWGKIGHPVQSRGLSPKDKTPWFTLVATGVLCLILGRVFLTLQRNYEQDFWQQPNPRRAGGQAVALNASAAVPSSEAVSGYQATSGKVTLIAGGVATELDASCGAEVNLDLDGFAVSWGLDFKTKTAAECCEACRAHKRRDDGKQCNSWVWCPEEKCWSPDIWDHKYQECWLKVQDDPRRPTINHKGAFPAAFRQEHKTAPEKTPWMAGVLV